MTDAWAWVNEIPAPVGIPAIDTTRASPARVYDAWLGGKDNLAVDRAAASAVADLHPGIIDAVRSNRTFLAAAVHRLAAAGIDQFLDIGAGLPTSPNVHEVATKAIGDSRVVYVDNDPIVLVHARALLRPDPATPAARVHVVDGDLTRPHEILDRVEQEALLDLSRPVALLLVAVLHFVPDDLIARQIVSALTGRLCPGSYVVISHAWAEHDEAGDAVRAAAGRYSDSTAPMRIRTRAEVEALFDGLEIQSPGLRQLQYRRRPVTGLAGIAAVVGD